MKAVVICPDRHPEVAFLARKSPLVLVRILGPTLISHWLTYLADRGAKEVVILASDRPDQLRAAVGRGERWGLKIEIIAGPRELTVAEARNQLQKKTAGWLPAPDDIVVADHLPAWPDRPLFASYATFYSVLSAWLPEAGGHRVGAKEISPGVWTGLRCRVDATARLIAPCWLGENVWVRGGATVGPHAMVENSAMVDHNAEVSSSWIGPSTYVGALTHVKNSLAWADGLLNHETGSFVEVTDAFLLGNLRGESGFDRSSPWLGRLLAATVAILTSPLILVAWLKNRGSGRPLFEAKRAVIPTAVVGSQSLREMAYSELNGLAGLTRRWPQLWSIWRGDFSWVGNRPLAREQAAQLETEFEQLWLAAPVGLVSLADTFEAGDRFDDESRAHASFYAVHADGKLNRTILRWLILRTSQKR